MDALAALYGGSSPLARGTRFKLGSMITMSPVHPRLRGELNSRMDDPGELIGSSPLARGTQRESPYEQLDYRFIPACAGNSAYFVASSLFTSVHPRLRGELILCVCYPSCFLRFIPACAGNSEKMVLSTYLRSVHPRLRGELRRGIPSPSGTSGSSPLARGTRLSSSGGRDFDRFIPACAGNSLKMVTTLH